jgi:eukaryotic-like serine/threonine-protein kinase
VHRDLKPANLFCIRRTDGRLSVKVLDFGISKVTAKACSKPDMSMTRTSALVGSPVYMSPEQMKSAKDVDARSDVWALGVILYELVGGRRPFDSDTLGGIMAQVLTESPPPIDTVRPGLPAVLVSAIGKCLEKDRDKRWANIAELAAALRPLASRQAQTLIERITGVRGEDGATRSSMASHAGNSALVSPSTSGSPSVTTPPWTETSGGRPPRSGKWAIAVATVLALLAVGATAIRHRARETPVTIPDATPEVTVAASATPPAREVLPTAAPTPAIAPPVATVPAPTASAPAARAAAGSTLPVTPKPAPPATGSKAKIAAPAPPAPAAAAPASARPPAHPAPPKPSADLLDTSN